MVSEGFLDTWCKDEKNEDNRGFHDRQIWQICQKYVSWKTRLKWYFPRYYQFLLSIKITGASKTVDTAANYSNGKYHTPTECKFEWDAPSAHPDKTN